MEPQLKPAELAGSNKQYGYINGRPGGNDTSLILGIVRDPLERKRINAEIMSLYGPESPSPIEQVGFVNFAPDNYELMMAGGEFCGNATRYAAYLALKGKPGQIQIKVSGVEKSLIAGVAENGESYAQMPIYSDPERVQTDLAYPENSTVYMEGITQYVDWNTTQIEGRNEEEIKAIGMDIIRRNGLDEGPAAGVMFAKKTKKGIEIVPVVYVKEIDTVFLETACGSGTTAVGMALAKKTGKSVVEEPIIQPSGQPIKVSVNYDGKEFKYAQIQGPVEILNTGVLIQTNSGPIAVERAITKEQVNVYLANGELLNAYNAVFGGSLYDEVFSYEEVMSDFMEYQQDGTLFFARSKDELVGFGASLPLSKRDEIAKIAVGFGIPFKSTQYMADLGVLEPWRKKGVGKALINERLMSFPKGTTVLMRTSEKNDESQRLYKELGFTQVKGMEQMVEQMRTSGKPEIDRRIFFTKVI